MTVQVVGLINGQLEVEVEGNRVTIIDTICDSLKILFTTLRACDSVQRREKGKKRSKRRKEKEINENHRRGQQRKGRRKERIPSDRFQL